MGTFFRKSQLRFLSEFINKVRGKKYSVGGDNRHRETVTDGCEKAGGHVLFRQKHPEVLPPAWPHPQATTKATQCPDDSPLAL